MPLLKIVSSDVMKGSNDRIRTKLGHAFELMASTGSTGNINLSLSSRSTRVHKEDEDLRGFEVWRMEPTNEFIKYVEVNPALITPIDKDAYKPNFKIPCRMYANIDNSKGDKFWQTYLAGGTWGDTSYEPCIDTSKVFYDCAFRTAGYYSSLEERLYGPLMTTFERNRTYNIQSNYFDYNKYLHRYQDWASNATSERVLVNNYLTRDYTRYIDDVVGESVGSAGGLFSDEIDDYTPQILELYDYYFPDGTIYKSSSLDRNQYYGEIFIDKPKTSGQLQRVARYQENIIFDHNYYSTYGSTEDYLIVKSVVGSDDETGKISLGNRAYLDSVELRTIDPDRIDSTCVNRLTDMYNISLTWAKLPELEFIETLSATSSEFVRTDDDYGGEQWGTTYGSMIRLGDSYIGKKSIKSMLEGNNYDSKFIEILKDIDEENIDDSMVPFITKRYITEKQQEYLGTTQTVETKYRTLKLLDLLRYVYNNPDGAINENYCFIGPPIPEHATTYTDNTLYRFANNKNLLNVVDDLLDYYRELFKDITEMDYDPTESGGPLIQKFLYESFFQANDRASEVLLYKVCKYAEGDSSPVQKFWIWNSSNAPDVFSLLDSQVKYDKRYTYKVFAYVATISMKYRYGDLKLTKQIGTIFDRDGDGYQDADVFTGEAGDLRPDLYCVQFYDAETKELADQLFTRASPTRDPDAPEYSSLSEYNSFATSQQDISKFPQLADFNLYVEPCCEIIEIPLFARTLKVLDSPPNSCTATPFQFLDNSHRIGFNIFAESFEERPFPITITDDDAEKRLEYLHSKNMLEYDDLSIFSESPARYIQIFKTRKKPTSFQDFQDKLSATIDLRIQNSPEFNFSNYIAADKLMPNTQYYYVFRLLNENKMPGPLSQIIVAELVDDGGYIYSLFDTLDSADFVPDPYTKTSKAVKKIFQLEPNINQISLDTSQADFLQTAASQMDNVQVGAAGTDLIWGKKFKIRLTSKKTGKKIDLNVNYKLQELDYSGAETT